MPKKIKITGKGLFGAGGEIPVGTQFTVKELPEAWRGRFEEIGGTDGEDEVTNPNAGQGTDGNPAPDGTDPKDAAPVQTDPDADKNKTATAPDAAGAKTATAKPADAKK